MKYNALFTVHTHTHTHTHTHIHTCTHTYTYTRVCTYAHTRTCACAHTHTHTHTHTHSLALYSHTSHETSSGQNSSNEQKPGETHQTSSLTKKEHVQSKPHDSDLNSNSNSTQPISDDSNGHRSGTSNSFPRKSVAIDMSHNECFTHRLLPSVSPDFDNVMDQVRRENREEEVREGVRE